MITISLIFGGIVVYLLFLQKEEDAKDKPDEPKKEGATTLQWLWFVAAIVGMCLLCVVLASLGVTLTSLAGM